MIRFYYNNLLCYLPVNHVPLAFQAGLADLVLDSGMVVVFDELPAVKADGPLAHLTHNKDVKVCFWDKSAPLTFRHSVGMT
jgi:hypothetical protein